MLSRLSSAAKSCVATKSLSITYDDGTPAYVAEWLSHAPSEFFWTRSTERLRRVTFKRTRGDEVIDIPLRQDKSFGWDHLSMDLNLPTLTRIRFGVLDRKTVELASSVSRPGFLQLDAGPLGLAEAKLRYTVRFALNFLFGCGLGLLGSSEFDAAHSLLRCELVSGVSPGGDREAPPIVVSASSRKDIDEAFCTEFVRTYLQREAAFDLNRVVWLLRHSLKAPVDMAAAYTGAAFEVLRTKFYAQPENEARSKRLPRDQWKPLRSALDAVVTQHAESAFADKAETSAGAPAGSMNRASYAEVQAALDMLNNVSGTRLNTQLLDDLGLAHGVAEKAALQARNDAAHGNPFEPKDAGVWLARVDALRTLTSRTLFAVLGLSPHGYIDYGSSGKEDFPARSWGEPQHLRGGA